MLGASEGFLTSFEGLVAGFLGGRASRRALSSSCSSHSAACKKCGD